MKLLLLAAGIRTALAVTPAYSQPQTAPTYERIAIVQPENDATEFDNAGDVDVKVNVSLTPRLRAGDRIALILDGTRASMAGVTAFRLSGVARGEHTLEAQVLDSGDSILISSAPVKFYLRQAPRLFHGRREK